MLAMTAVVGLLGGTGLLIAARKTIDSVQRIPGIADTFDPVDTNRVEITQGQGFGHSTPKRYG